MSIKQELFSKCQAFVDAKLNTIKTTIAELQQALNSETKSTAGDKHETGRAMLQLEREKVGQQLAEVQKTNAVLAKIDIEKTGNIIGLGSVVYTNKANYFIAISVGEVKVDDTMFYAISPLSPIGQSLLGKTVGDVVVFREQQLRITTIV